MLSGIDMEHVFVSMFLLPSWALITTTSESSLSIQSSFSCSTKYLLSKPFRQTM